MSKMPTITLQQAEEAGYTFPNIQTILFDKDKWTRKTSTEWLKKHGYRTTYYRTTKNQIRRMQHNPVENATYYTKKLPNGVQLVFQNIRGYPLKHLKRKVKGKHPVFLPSTGEGIVDNIVSFASRFIPKKRTAGLLPPKSRQLLEEVKNEQISSMVVIRTPIESWINKALQTISLGSWQNAVKQYGYDSLFHLSVWINNKYVLHKIEATTLARDTNPIKQDSQTMVVNGPFPTIGELIQNTLTKIGPERFSNYDPKNLNCQDFIIDVLNSNNLLTPELQKFIKQDAVAIFNQTPKWTNVIAKAITDLGAIKSRLVEGEGRFSKYIPEQKKIAKRLKMDFIKDIVESPLKNKKYRVILTDGAVVDYGNPNYEDYLQHKDKKRRQRFLKRWSTNKNIDNIYSPVYYIVRLNW